jgi:RNA polymerase sigma-70 factor (ECF subfamily)
MDDSDATRPSLLVRIRDAGDGQAWSQFVRVYSPLVYRYVRRRGVQDADAADVTQDVLRTIARSIGRFDYDRRKGSFRSWLMSVARSRLCDFLADRGRQTCGSGETGVQRLLEEQPDAADEQEIWEQEYQRCLFNWAAEQIRDEFQDSTWQAFWQTSVEGKDTRQVARSLDMTVGAVYIARSRVLARLRKQIEQIEA